MKSFFWKDITRHKNSWKNFLLYLKDVSLVHGYFVGWIQGYKFSRSVRLNTIFLGFRCLSKMEITDGNFFKMLSRHWSITDLKELLKGCDSALLC